MYIFVRLSTKKCIEWAFDVFKGIIKAKSNIEDQVMIVVCTNVDYCIFSYQNFMIITTKL